MKTFKASVEQIVTDATYNGDVTHMALKAQVVGPNTTGEVLVAVVAVYDEVRDNTRVGFAYAPGVGSA